MLADFGPSESLSVHLRLHQSSRTKGPREAGTLDFPRKLVAKSFQKEGEPPRFAPRTSSNGTEACSKYFGHHESIWVSLRRYGMSSHVGVGKGFFIPPSFKH